MPHPYAAGVGQNIGQHPDIFNATVLRAMLPARQRVAERLAKNVAPTPSTSRSWGARAGAHGARHAGRGSARWEPDTPASWIEMTGTALKRHRPYISMNNPAVDRIQFLMIDCDHDRWGHLPGSLPMPLWTAISRGSERHHHGIGFRTPVLTGADAHMKPRRAMAALEASLRAIYDGDPNYTNTLTKNPFATDEWEVILWPRGRLVEFKDFDGWFVVNDDHEKPWWKQREIDPRASCGYSRNCDMFDATRFFAYRLGEPDFDAIFATAQQFNDQLSVPLPHSEVLATARSIAKFMAARWTGTKRSVVLPPHEIRSRQAASGAASAAKNKARNEFMIEKAIEKLQKKGLPTSLSSIAKTAGVSVRAVSNYRQKSRAKTLMEGMQNGVRLSGIP